MSACGNCGQGEAVTPCLDVWVQPHTHPRAWNDLTPVPCALVLCDHCVRTVTRNLRLRPPSAPVSADTERQQ